MNTRILKNVILVLCLLLAGSFSSLYAQETAKNETNEKNELKVLGDPGEGMFFVQYNLPKDAKKVIWTVTDEKGEVLIKEKYKKVKAGKNRFQYNYLHGPDGLHTFKIVADNVVISEKEVLKKKKK